jgi:hypothetical protein
MGKAESQRPFAPPARPMQSLLSVSYFLVSISIAPKQKAPEERLRGFANACLQGSVSSEDTPCHRCSGGHQTGHEPSSISRSSSLF